MKTTPRLIQLLSADEKIDPHALLLAEQIAALPFVQKAVCLPDFHWKATMEAPSSFAVATKNHIVPHFSSTSLNCGMGLIKTGLFFDEFNKERIKTFFSYFRKSQDSKDKYDINQEELLSLLKKGAAFLIGKYHLPAETLGAIESKGNCLKEDISVSTTDIAKLLHPEDMTDPNYMGLKGLGLGFGGNHFFEMQYVSEVLDEKTCESIHIHKNEVVFMYHTGGGIIPGFIGGYYARRTKGYVHNLKMVYNKLRFHFRTTQDILSFRKKWRYYFSDEKYIAIQADTPEGHKQKILNEIAMNYGYGYRMATIARAREALANSTDSSLAGFQLLCDIPHNTIGEEAIDGKTYWVHRHNACCMQQGEIGILPGMNNTSSFLIAGGENGGQFLNTIPHGAGDAVKKFEKIDERIDPGTTTSKFLDMEKDAKPIEHIGDTGVNSVIDTLSKQKLIRPIARLTPFAVLKDFRPNL